MAKVSRLGVEMLDSQHFTAAFSRGVELLTKEPLVRIWPCKRIILYQRLILSNWLVELIGIEPTTS
jgi:hypothetical protein